MTLRRLLLPLAAVAAMSACDSPVEVCTLIGCSSGLTVELSRLPAGAFSVEILPEASPSNPPTYRVDCGGSAPPCGTQVFFPNLVIDRAQVRVTTADGTVTQEVGPVTYRTSYPNGRQCSPACQRATVAVALPE